jgi:predicted SprT family Zn-dependent metalloprotease
MRTNHPRALEVPQLAQRLLRLYGLEDWSFAYNRRKVEMGLCHFEARRIELSIYFVERNGMEAIVDTLLHEIAHALVGWGHGHDACWKRKCVEIGATPGRTCESALMPEGRWRAQCRCCGMMHHRHRRPKRLVGWWCRRCGRERGQLRWGWAG